MKATPAPIAFLPWILSVGLLLSGFATAREEPDEKTARYLEALLKRPSGGPLFERFYQSWLDQGTSAGLEAHLRQRADAPEATPADAMLLGWFFAKRGEDNEAIARFRSALEKDPSNAAAWLEKAKAETRVLDLEAALSDLESGLSANPEEALAIEIGKLKGRLLSRSGKGEEAVASWKALAAAHPEDEDLQEDLVELHLAEGLDAEAVALMEALVAGTKDSYDRVIRQLRLADLHQRGGDREKATALYDESLAAAGRDTWLETEILSQLERSFRREDDLAGLKTHLATAIEKDPGRIALRKRQAAALLETGDADAAIAAFQEVLKLTPGDRANREAFVDLLGKAGRPGEAADQIAALSEQNPADAELLTQLALWRDAAGRKEEAKAAVEAFLKASGGSEYDHLRAARLLEQFKDDEAAGAIFEQMVRTFPASVEAREARAEFLHRTGKKDEAIAEWKSIATEGDAPTAHRAARALAGRGEHGPAYEILTSRAGDFGTDFTYLGQLATEAVALEKFDEALAWAEKRLALATSSVDLNETTRQILPILDRLKKVDTYRDGLTSKSPRTLAETCLLAELLERNRQFEEAEALLAPELEKGEKLAIIQQVRLFVSREEWSSAADTQLRLVESADGGDTANIQELVRLLGRAERYDVALHWIGEWKKRSPGATQPWTDQAGILLEMDQADQAIATLKAAARKFEDSVELRSQLAGLHFSEDEYAEAERIYWQLYEESDDISQQLGWVGQLAMVAAEAGQTDRLIEQFEERRRNNRTSLTPLLAIAEIHQRNGDSEKRRATLLEATKLRPEDLKLLHEIARIEEQEGDWEAAVKTLQSALPLDKTRDTRERIALLTLSYGEDEDGYRLLAEVAGDQNDPDTVLRTADAMISRSDWERVSVYLAGKRAAFPDDYRIPYLEGVALVELSEPEKATGIFVDLLDWKVELPQPPTPAKPSTVVRQNATTDFYKAFPEGMADLNQGSNSYEVFRYRQALQQSSMQYRFRLMQGSGGLVPLPKTLELLKSYAVTHLRSLAADLEPEQRTELGQTLLARGVKSGDILLELPFSDYIGRGGQVFDSTLLDRYPDRLNLWAQAVMLEANKLYQSAGAIDAAMLTRCYEKLRADFPLVALAAATYAAASGTDEGAALLDRAFADLPELTDLEGSSRFSSMLSSVLGSNSPFQGSRTSLLPERFRGPLLGIYRGFREQSLKDPEVQKYRTLAGSFYFTDDTPWMMRAAESLDAYTDHLDAEIARYEELKRSGDKSKAPSLLAGYRQYTGNQMPLFGEAVFPPIELPDFPPNVLVQFVRFPNYQWPPDIEPELLAKQVDRVKSPVLRAIYAHRAGDEARAEKEIDALLAAPGPAPALALQARVLAASWHAVAKEDDAKAIALLSEARGLTSDKELRGVIDGSIVFHARRIANGEKALSGKEDLIATGREAALRFRYGTLDPQRREELADALGDLGLASEAEKLRKVVTPVRSVSASRMTVTRAPADLDDRVKQLFDAGKEKEAVKLAEQSLRPAFRSSNAPTGGYIQIDYQITNFLSNIRSKRAILDAIVKSFDPGDPAGAEVAALQEYATLQLFIGELEPALANYEAALARLPEGRQMQAKARIAAILAITNPETAAKRLAELDARGRGQFGRELSFIQNVMQYSRSNDEDEFRRNMNLGRTLTEWIEAIDEKDFGKLDLSYAGQVLDFYIPRQVSGNVYLPGLFYDLNPGSSWDRDSAETKEAEKLAATRREVHDALCLTLLGSPQNARFAFSSYIGVRLHEDLEAACADPKNRDLAMQAIAGASRPYRGGRDHNYSSSRQFDKPGVPRWLPEEFLLLLAAREGDAAAAAGVLTAVKRLPDREVIASSNRFHDLCFGEGDSIAKSAKLYLTSFPNRYQGNATYADDSACDAPEKLIAILKARKNPLQDSHLDTLAADLAKSADALSNLPLLILAERAIRDRQPELARRRLDALTLSLLGSEENWKLFRKEAERRVTNGNSYYYQGGNFTQPKHQVYAALMERLCNQPDTLFTAVAYLQEKGLDQNGQVTGETLLNRLATKRLSEDAEFAVALIDNPVFMGSVKSFRSLDFGNGNILQKCLDQIAKDGTTKTKVRERAASKGTYGGDLVAAYLTDPRKPAFAAALGKHLPSIKTELDEAAKADLASFVNAVYGTAGVNYESLNEDARAALSLLGAAREKSAEEAANEFLAVKDLAAIRVNGSYDLERHLISLMQPLWSAEKWDKGVQVYWHGVDLARAMIKKGQWNDSTTTGWNLEGDTLYDIFQDAPGSDLQRIALYSRILASDKESRVPHYLCVEGSDNDLLAAFNRAGGEAKLEEALDHATMQLHSICGEGSEFTIAGTLEWMIMKFRPALIPRGVAWADSRSEGRPWSPAARETAMLLRNALAKSITPQLKAAAAKIPDLQSWEAHYVARLRDDSMRLTDRVALADKLCNNNGKLSAEVAQACATVLAEAYLADAPLNSWQDLRIQRAFTRLPRTPEWEAVARRVVEGWAHKNRNNSKPDTSGLRYAPFNQCVLEALRTHLLLGDKAASDSFFKDKTLFERVKSDSRTVLTLVTHGAYDDARRFVTEGFEFQDINDDYFGGINDYKIAYSQQAHERIPEFLSTIDDPGLRCFAELILVGALDPAPEDREANAAYPPRGARLSEAAKRFDSVVFDPSARGTLLRQRCLEQVAATDPSASVLTKIYEQEYKPGDCQALCALADYKKIEHGAHPLAALAALRFRKGDISVVEDLLKATSEKSVRYYYRREMLEHFTWRLIESLKHRGPNAPPEEMGAYATALGRMLSEPEKNVASHEHLGLLIGAYLTASGMAGRETETIEWAKALDNERAEMLAASMRSKIGAALGGFPSILKTKVPDLKLRPTFEKRDAVLKIFLACPLVERAYGGNEVLFQPLIDSGIITEEETLGDPGKRAAEQFPRGGWAAAELARRHADKGNWDAALDWSKKSLDGTKPEANPAVYTRISVRHVDLLLEAKREKEAAAALNELTEAVDENRLPDNLREMVTGLRKRVKP